ncbi:MAG: hypothetical protein Q4Q23_06535 [Methanobacteriaceae archaeon]|nr:hypothetical protein [Methanobacteriaceae archaeon]
MTNSKFKLHHLVLILIAILIVTMPLGYGLSEIIQPKNSESATVSVGSTVTAGMKIIDSEHLPKIPITFHPEYIINPIMQLDILSVFTTITTGTVPQDVVAGDNSLININGTVNSKLDGPGVLRETQDGKLKVEQPNKIIWAYKMPYTIGVKEGDQLKIVENNQTTKTISSSDINNDTIKSDFTTASAVQTWFKTAKNGENFTLDYSLGKFNDNRSEVYGKDKITELFGSGTYDYMRNFTSYAPVLIYEHNATETEISNATSVVKDLAGYPTQIRAANAKAFADGWNGTIIPPKMGAHGKSNVTFISIPEAGAESGTASHGVCPAGRSLRAAVTSLGYSLPVGMAQTGDDDAILFDYHATTEVLVKNDGDYPIKIIMWSTGDGGATQIHTKIIQLKDNSTYVNNTNSTNSTNTTS